MWREARFAGSGWWGAGTARHAGQVARLSDQKAVVACAKSCEARLRGGGRWWRRKAAAFERGAWAAGGEAGVTASGQAGEACARAAWERGQPVSKHVSFEKLQATSN